MNLIPLKTVCPELRDSILKDKLKRRDVEDLKDANIDYAALETIYNQLSLKNLREHIASIGEMGIDFKDRDDQVEKDSRFQWDHKYVVVFSAYLAQNLALPSLEQYWQAWLKMNYRAMDYNWSDSDQPFRETYGTRSVVREYMDSGLAKGDAQDKIIKGAKLRAYRFAAAALRELHALLWLSNSSKVFTHPLIDCTCKYDAIATTDSEVIGVAICLESTNSQDAAGAKADNIPSYFKKEVNRAVGLKISQKNTKGVYYGSAYELNDLKDAVEGKKFKVIQNDEYTWTNQVV